MQELSERGFAILVALLLAGSGYWVATHEREAEPLPGGPGSPGGDYLAWGEPVWLPRAPECVDEDNGQLYPEFAIGYEPSIAVDQQGNLYYTAHKDLRWSGPNGGPGGGEGGAPGPGPFVCGFPWPGGSQTSWDYYASWFFVSQDGGETWGPPNDWGTADFGSQYPGDEGDIGVDANGRVYFVDTTLEDNWLHIWDDGGNAHANSQRLQSTTADDRPWVTAHGDGVVHYLGNNGVSVPGIPLTDGTSGVGRYWYYRGTTVGDQVVFDQGRVIEGGWAHIAAETDGPHVYIVQEANNGGSGGVKVWVSDDWGANWAEPVTIGPLEGSHPEGYPWIAAGENGTVMVTWQESPQGGKAAGTLYLSRSDDYGVTWEYWDVTPREAVFLYPTIDLGTENRLGFAYYANEGNGTHGEHTAGDRWYLYGAIADDLQVGEQLEFLKADPQPLHTSSEAEAAADDLHPLHDFFEAVIAPDGSLNIAYQYNLGQHPWEVDEEQRYLMFIRGELA